ncbi:MAG: hypothetical protein COA84_09655 [Robiginitomaculum sp.]|nr:MAG: hypothetical protein COA84_09655 [Robiginitomaculum sp.]
MGKGIGVQHPFARFIETNPMDPPIKSEGDEGLKSEQTQPSYRRKAGIQNGISSSIIYALWCSPTDPGLNPG